MESLEPSSEERSMEEGRNGSEAVHGLAGGSRGRGAAHWPSRAPESGLQKWRGQTRVYSDSKRDLTSGRL